MSKAPAVHTERGFPYYSYTFGCEVRDRKHKLELEKKHGVIPVTVNDVERSADAISSRKKKIDLDIEMQDRELALSPHFKRGREMISRGYFTKHLPRDQREKAQKKLEQQLAQARKKR